LFFVFSYYLFIVIIFYRSRLDECKKQLRDILDQEKLAGASLVIFANKQDLGGALSYEEIKRGLDLEGV
jgi:ADP-ribosylation factor-like protein 2